jgi:hypothetical protein
MKILPISLLLILAAGCGRSYQRFIPASGALVDTKTGRLCDGSPQHDIKELPLCYDLYKGK